MRIIQFNSIGGASGDMMLGAFAGLGVDMHAVNKMLADMLPSEKFQIVTNPVSKQGMAGFQVSVKIEGEDGEEEDHLEHSHHHEEHHHNHHSHEHSAPAPHEHHHAHRSFSDIRNIIEASRLPDEVKKLSVKVFSLVADAEAKIHSKTPDEVHFHEVGAVDSIIDIVASCLAFHMLGADAVNFGPLPLGHGTIKCRHGIYPSPAPATLEILKGLPLYQTDEPFELITPTGAALLRGFPFAEIPFGASLTSTAYSFGHRELHGRPNLLRALLFENISLRQAESHCVMLETNIDDMSPEIIGAVFAKLFEGGALDVFTSPITMKKQRSALLLSVICTEVAREKMLEIIFSETSSFGIRETVLARHTLERSSINVETSYGPIKIKIGRRGGRIMSASPEYEDCLAASETHSVPLKKVFAAAIAAYEKN